MDDHCNAWNSDVLALSRLADDGCPLHGEATDNREDEPAVVSVCRVEAHGHGTAPSAYPLVESRGFEPICIREASAREVEAVARLTLRLADETDPDAFARLDWPTVVAGVRSLARDPGSAILVARTQEAIVGMLILSGGECSEWRDGRYLTIASFYVERAYRSRGVGQALYDHVRTRAQRIPSIRGIQLHVHRENARARWLYEQAGFHRTQYLLMRDEF